jgi:hypothetical protein
MTAQDQLVAVFGSLDCTINIRQPDAWSQNAAHFVIGHSGSTLPAHPTLGWSKTSRMTNHTAGLPAQVEACNAYVREDPGEL